MTGVRAAPVSGGYIGTLDARPSQGTLNLERFMAVSRLFPDAAILM